MGGLSALPMWNDAPVVCLNLLECHNHSGLSILKAFLPNMSKSIPNDRLNRPLRDVVLEPGGITSEITAYGGNLIAGKSLWFEG